MHTLSLALVSGLLFIFGLSTAYAQEERSVDTDLSSKKANVITFVADLWPPFNGEPNSDSEGYMMDVAREIFEPQGYVVEYRNLPWNRAIVESRKGRYNAIIGASKSDASDFIFPEEELGRNRLSFYVPNASTWTFQGVESLKSVYVGTIDGYDYRSWFRAYEKEYPDNIYVRFGNAPLEENIRLMLHGRLDVVVDTEAAIRSVAQSMGVLDQVKSAGEDHIGDVSYIYHAFSPVLPESKQHAALLSKGIRELRSSGRLNEILSKYGLRDWQLR